MLCHVLIRSRQEADRVVMAIALRVFTQSRTADDIGRGDAGVHAHRHICVCHVFALVGEFTDGIGSVEKLIRLV
jgi:hypothetical protein